MKKGRKTRDGEEASEPSAITKDVLRITTSSLKLPEGIDATEESAAAVTRVVLIVVAIVLGFVAVIAWLIHQTPQ